MKKIFLLSIIGAFAVLSVSAQNENLSNNSILELDSAGFSDEIITMKIEQAGSTQFDLSIDALKVLKEKGVSDAIIMAMMKSQAGKKPEEAKAEPVEAAKLGIYVKEEKNDKKLVPVAFSGTETNNLASKLTRGIASSKLKSMLNKSTSENPLETNTPVFDFFFSKEQGNVSAVPNDWWFAASNSPHDFILARLIVNKKHRELITGSVNFSGTSIGIDDAFAIECDVKPIDGQTFEVTPKKPLLPGEYCFYYQGMIPQGGYSNQSVFDFTITVGGIVGTKSDKGHNILDAVGNSIRRVLH